MTQRLYYTDSYRTEFDAMVTTVEEADGRFIVLLDRTAFYPTSGGQPHDLGTLSAVPVLDVIDRDDGMIAHVLDEAVEPGEPVRGQIDWARRFDHMQQHTGQHILSAAFDRCVNARTVSFHLGTDVSTIDLSAEVSASGISAAEDEANRIVWENRPVSVRFVSDEEAATLPLRKEPKRTGRLRIVDVEDFDLSACGGTHVARTGSIGIIAVASVERFKGGLRVGFVCGGRALKWARSQRLALEGSVRLLSVLPSELPEGIERLQGEHKELRRNVKALSEKVAQFDALSLARKGEQEGGVTRVVQAVEGYDANGLKALAQALIADAGRAVALLSAASPRLIVIARSAGVPVDSAAALRTLMARFGGRGGGRAEMAQAGGLEGNLDEMLQAAREALTPPQD